MKKMFIVGGLAALAAALGLAVKEQPSEEMKVVKMGKRTKVFTSYALAVATVRVHYWMRNLVLVVYALAVATVGWVRKAAQDAVRRQRD